jgi:hypothetical protein
MEKADVIRAMLVVDMVALALLALVYLRQRRMSMFAYLCWGFLAVLVPVLGPFFVIANRPGEWEPGYSVQKDLQRVTGWMRRMLPEAPSAASRLERARARRKKRLKE